MKFEYTFEEVKQLIVLIAVIGFGAIILIMSYIYPAEFTNEYLIMLNLIIGALIGIISPQAAKLLNKKEENAVKVDEVNEDPLSDFHRIPDEPVFNENEGA